MKIFDDIAKIVGYSKSEKNTAVTNHFHINSDGGPISINQIKDPKIKLINRKRTKPLSN